jgi:hypothetical protein
MQSNAGKYQFACDSCGGPGSTNAKSCLRQRPLCLPCLRIRNNWSCGSCGSTDPHHDRRRSGCSS